MMSSAFIPKQLSIISVQALSKGQQATLERIQQLETALQKIAEYAEGAPAWPYAELISKLARNALEPKP